MSIFHLDDLTGQERLLAEDIVDVVVDICPPGTYNFTLQNLYAHSSRLQENSRAQDITAIVRGIVNSLRDQYNLIERIEGTPSGYKITNGRLLFYLVREKRLQQEIEKATQALEKAKQEINGAVNE